MYVTSNDISRLVSAIVMLRALLATTTSESEGWVQAAMLLASMLWMLYADTDHVPVLVEAAAAGRQATKGQAPGTTRHVNAMTQLGDILLRLGADDADANVSEEAVTVCWYLASAAVAGTSEYADRMMKLGAALQLHYVRGHHIATLQEAAAVVRDALASTPPDSPERDGRWQHLAVILRVLADNFPDNAALIADAEAAEREGHSSVGQLELDLEPEASIDRSDEQLESLVAQARTALQKAVETPAGIVHLRSALLEGRECLKMLSPGDLRRLGLTADLSAGLRAMFVYSGDAQLLEEAVNIGESTLARSDAGSTDREACLVELSRALRGLSDLTDNHAHHTLSEASCALAIRELPDDHLDLCEVSANLGVANAALWRTTKDPKRLLAALAWGLEAMKTMEADDPRAVSILFDLGTAASTVNEVLLRDDEESEGLLELVKGNRTAYVAFGLQIWRTLIDESDPDDPRHAEWVAALERAQEISDRMS